MLSVSCTQTVVEEKEESTTWPLPAPASFSVSNLIIQPPEVEPKEAVAIAISIINTGSMEGSYTVALKINGVSE